MCKDNKNDECFSCFFKKGNEFKEGSICWNCRNVKCNFLKETRFSFVSSNPTPLEEEILELRKENDLLRELLKGELGKERIK